MNNKVQHVTTEATSQEYKLHMLYAWGGMAASCFWVLFGDEVSAYGFLGILTCAIWLYSIKVQVWWNHG